MRLVRLIAGLALFTIGLPVLLAGAALCWAGGHRDAGGAYGGTLERIDTPGRAVVVTDLDALLRRDAPFTRTGSTRLRIIGRTAADPAFIGIAPTEVVTGYLSATSYARIEQIGVARGRLPVRAMPAGTGLATVGLPGEQGFWSRRGVGVLDLVPDDVRGHRLSLVVMHPDARAGVALDLRAEVRPGWLDLFAWGSLAIGALCSVLGLVLLGWQIRPREVVFVVEPDQVPVLSARLGVTALRDFGGPARSSPDGPVPAGVAAGRPATLADVLVQGPPDHPASDRRRSVGSVRSAAGAARFTTPPPIDITPLPLWPPPATGQRSHPVVAPVPGRGPDQTAPAPAPPRPAPTPMPVPVPMPPPPAPVPVPSPPPVPAPVPAAAVAGPVRVDPTVVPPGAVVTAGPVPGPTGTGVPDRSPLLAETDPVPVGSELPDSEPVGSEPVGSEPVAPVPVGASSPSRAASNRPKNFQRPACGTTPEVQPSNSGPDDGGVRRRGGTRRNSSTHSAR